MTSKQFLKMMKRMTMSSHTCPKKQVTVATMNIEPLLKKFKPPWLHTSKPDAGLTLPGRSEVSSYSRVSREQSEARVGKEAKENEDGKENTVRENTTLKRERKRSCDKFLRSSPRHSGLRQGAWEERQGFSSMATAIKKVSTWTSYETCFPS